MVFPFYVVLHPLSPGVPGVPVGPVTQVRPGGVADLGGPRGHALGGGRGLGASGGGHAAPRRNRKFGDEKMDGPPVGCCVQLRKVAEKTWTNDGKKVDTSRTSWDSVQLVYKWLNSMVYGRYNELVNGDYVMVDKQIYNWGPIP